jgi:hypothetical protein
MTMLKVVVLGFCFACGGAIDVQADTGTPTDESAATEVAAEMSISGHWQAAETEEQEKERHEAIETVTKEMSRFKRGKARGRLKERTSPPANLTIEMTDSTVTITSGDKRVELVLDGDPIEIEGDQGTLLTTAKMMDERLVVEYRGDKGVRTVSYHLVGTDLMVDVTTTNDQFDGPLTFVTTYVRME